MGWSCTTGALMSDDDLVCRRSDCCLTRVSIVETTRPRLWRGGAAAAVGGPALPYQPGVVSVRQILITFWQQLPSSADIQRRPREPRQRQHQSILHDDRPAGRRGRTSALPWQPLRPATAARLVRQTADVKALDIDSRLTSGRFFFIRLSAPSFACHCCSLQSLVLVRQLLGQTSLENSQKRTVV